ncbi:MAG: hypothetical protein CMQ40_11990 [Gammaproteobacteria bacterium]|nr:hypothetical protein [Gammaproteobacteria bacterium]
MTSSKPRKTELLRSEVSYFCQQHHDKNPRDFFFEMEKAGFLRFDWPQEYGGRGWSREEQLILIKAMAEYGCPIFPESISAGAPLVIGLASEDKKRFLLEKIITNVSDWRIHGEADAEGIFWNQMEDSISILCEGKTYTLGESGHGAQYVSTYFSVGCICQQWLTGLEHLKRNSRAQQSTTLSSITEEQINFLSAMFNFLNPKMDKLVALQANLGKDTVYQLLISLIGYYGIIRAQDVAGNNEPIPFVKERLFLEDMRRLSSLDEIILKNCWDMEI